MEAMMAFLKGILIGIANIIPGVSGGTVALLLGIYQRLVEAAAAVNGVVVRKTLALLSFRRAAWSSFWRVCRDKDLFFLGWIGVGAFFAVIVASRIMEHILDQHHAPAYAFFAGLVLCSVVLPWRYLTRRSWREWLSATIAALLTIGLTLSVSDQAQIEKAERRAEMQAEVATSEVMDGITTVQVRGVGEQDATSWPRLVMIFLAAVLAISAMVLPGVSGSFILLLLGVYFDLLRAVNNREYWVILVFAAGAIVGLLIFSRFMRMLLNLCFNTTMAFMVGLMVGSLYRLWPFKRVEVIGDQTLYLSNVWRGASMREEILSLIMFVVGCLIVTVFLKLGKGHERRWNSVLK